MRKVARKHLLFILISFIMIILTPVSFAADIDSVNDMGIMENYDHAAFSVEILTESESGAGSSENVFDKNNVEKVPLKDLALEDDDSSQLNESENDDEDNFTHSNEGKDLDNGLASLSLSSSSSLDFDFGNWDELFHDIENLKPGDVYNFEHDYSLSSDSSLGALLLSADNVTINGNGHTLMGYSNHSSNGGLGSLITVKGDNVSITNLTISDAGYETASFVQYKNDVSECLGQYDGLFGMFDNSVSDESGVNSTVFFNKWDMLSSSPISWLGDDGLISYCLFKNNMACVGGSVSWFGNNGCINKSIFLNSSASRVGGVIYLNGENFILSDSYFSNSTSLWADDIIYLGPDFKNGSFYQLYTPLNSSNFCIDGRFSNFDPLAPQFKMNVLGVEIDFTKCLFDVLTFGGIYETEDISYYGQVFNGTDFIFVFVKDFGDGVFINQEFRFANVIGQNVFADDVGNGESRNLSANLEANMGIDALYDYDDKIIPFVESNVLRLFNEEDFAVNFLFTVFANVSGIQDYEKTLEYKADNFFGKYMNVYDEYRSFMRNGQVSCAKALRVDFLDKYSFTSHSTWNPLKMGFDTIYIDGHDSKIIGDAGKKNEYIWAKLDKDHIMMVNNITITEFNNAFINDGGYLFLSNMLLHKNKMDYLVDCDYGAAIQNGGLCACVNCIFTDNYCSNGGAIFNQGSLALENCTFTGNKAYRNGNDLLNVNEGLVTIDGDEINGSLGIVKYKKNMNTVLRKVIQYGTVAISFVIGLAIGYACKNPIKGGAIGLGVGFALGMLAGTAISYNTFDMHYCAWKSTLILAGASAGAGAVGGIIGGLVGKNKEQKSLVNQEACGSAYGLDDASEKSTDTVEEIFKERFGVSFKDIRSVYMASSFRA